MQPVHARPLSSPSLLQGVFLCGLASDIPVMEATMPKAAKRTTAIVTITHGEPTTTTLAIAAGTKNEHPSVIALARKYLHDLEEFGPCRFEIDVAQRAQGGGAKREYAVLNEQQSTLLLTYMRNTEIVRAFKKRLVGEFFRMRKELMRIAVHRHDPAHRLVRQQTSDNFRAMNQVLEFSREEIGKKTESHHFINEAKLVNAALTGKFESIDRNNLTTDELRMLCKLESKNIAMLASHRTRDYRRIELFRMAAEVRNRYVLRISLEAGGMLVAA